MLYQSFKMAVKAIAGNKMRSLLTILGVVIGVVSIVVLVAIAQGTNASVISSIEGMGTNLLSVTIRSRRNNPITLDALNDLAEEETIAHIAPYMTISGTVKAGNSTYSDGTLVGTGPGYEDIRLWTIEQGRFLKSPDLDNRSFVAVLGHEAAADMFGDANAVGNTFTINGYTFTVVGVLQEVGTSASGSQDNMIVVPYTLSQRLFGKTTGVTSFYVSAASADSVSATQDALKAYLNKAFNLSSTSSTSSYYSIYNQSDMLSTLNETTQTLTLMLGGISAISLLVGGIGIMNIMLVSVSERTKEIGIRKAVGASRGNILSQFLIEALAVSLLGGLIGLGLSFAGLQVLAPILSMTLSVSPTIAGLAIGFSVFIGVVFGLYPANKASKLKPIDALHYGG